MDFNAYSNSNKVDNIANSLANGYIHYFMKLACTLHGYLYALIVTVNFMKVLKMPCFCVAYSKLS